MLFYAFDSQEERRRSGGSGFLEIQYCKLPLKTKVKRIVSAGSMDYWQKDSLYIRDENVFFREYGGIFNCGIYNNLESGPVDIFGINYYAPCLTDGIIERIRREEPMDHKILAEWLIGSKEYNGFYILGI